MGPDERLFRQHLEGAPYLIGVEEGRWGGEESSPLLWPHIVFWVQALVKPGCPDRYHLKFELSNYPKQAPTAMPWDFEKSTQLAVDKWPRGGRFVSDVFKHGWKKDALYAPCDRLAIEGHPAWPQEHPADFWRPKHTICNYLEYIYRLLNSKEYLNG
jgi:hypothetical protein